MRKYFLLLLLFALPAWLPAQNAWTIYNTSNSPLLENSVRAIAVDSVGGKWIGTEYGLAYFDNTNWTIYLTSNSGLPHNDIRALQFDAMGNLWIGTFLGGLVKYDGSSWTVYDQSNSGLPDNFVKSIAFDNNGVMWVGTIGGLGRFDGTTWTSYTIFNSALVSDNINQVLVDHLNRKILATVNGGLVIYNDTTWNILTIQNGSGIPDNSINGLAEDSIGNLWLASAANGIIVYRANGVGWFWYYTGSTNIPTNSITCILLDSIQQAWSGSIDKGLIKKSGIYFSNYSTLNSGIPDDYLQCMVLQDGIFWLGTKSQGLVRFDESLLTGLEDPVQSINVSLFPNPAKDFFYVNANGNQIEKISLLDCTGKELNATKEKTPGDQSRISVPGIASGMYFVRIQLHEGKTISYKIILTGK